MSPRLLRGPALGIITFPLIAAFVWALIVASSPRLHENLHAASPHHECAATIMAAGNCENGPAPQMAPQIQDAPAVRAFLPPRLPNVVGSIASSVLEHAPPLGE
ncbi:MAG TPA: hypothetical protein VGH08_06860 [Chthoniobacterales bacterium]